VNDREKPRRPLSIKEIGATRVLSRAGEDKQSRKARHKLEIGSRAFLVKAFTIAITDMKERLVLEV
jgi:hypothetical protein